MKTVKAWVMAHSNGEICLCAHAGRFYKTKKDTLKTTPGVLRVVRVEIREVKPAKGETMRAWAVIRPSEGIKPQWVYATKEEAQNWQRSADTIICVEIREIKPAKRGKGKR